VSSQVFFDHVTRLFPRPFSCSVGFKLPLFIDRFPLFPSCIGHEQIFFSRWKCPIRLGHRWSALRNPSSAFQLFLWKMPLLLHSSRPLLLVLWLFFVFLLGFPCAEIFVSSILPMTILVPLTSSTVPVPLPFFPPPLFSASFFPVPPLFFSGDGLTSYSLV